MESREVWWAWQKAVVSVICGVLAVMRLGITLLAVSYNLYLVTFHWLLNRLASNVYTVVRLPFLVFTIQLQYNIQVSYGSTSIAICQSYTPLSTHPNNGISRISSIVSNAVSNGRMALRRNGPTGESPRLYHHAAVLWWGRFYAGRGDSVNHYFFVRRCTCSQCLLMEHNRHGQDRSPRTKSSLESLSSSASSSESSRQSTPGKLLKGIGLNLAAPYTQSVNSTSPSRKSRPSSHQSLDEQIRILALREMAVVELSDQIIELQVSLEKLRSETMQLRNLIKRTVHTQIAADPTTHPITLHQASAHPLWNNLSKPLNMLLQFDLLLQAEIEKSMTPAAPREPKSRRPSSDLKPFKNNSVIPIEAAQITTSPSSDQWNKELLLQNVSSSIYSFVNDVKSNVMVSLSDEDIARSDPESTELHNGSRSGNSELHHPDKSAGNTALYPILTLKTRIPQNSHPQSRSHSMNENGSLIDLAPQKTVEKTHLNDPLGSPTRAESNGIDTHLTPSFPTLAPTKNLKNSHILPNLRTTESRVNGLVGEVETHGNANFPTNRPNLDQSSPTIDLDKLTFEDESDENISIDFGMYSKTGNK